ncbi:MAG: DUF896 domain-containing protein [Eubacteriales bacterium]
MTEEKMGRINELAKLAKERSLTAEEIGERDILRREYIDSVKGTLVAQLDHTFLVSEDGKRQKLEKKDQK